MSEACSCCDGGGACATQCTALLAAIEVDDLDAAIELGLLSFEPTIGATCDRCRPSVERLLAARDERRAALAARERHRQRNARLAQRAELRAARRLATSPALGDASKPALPAAAAAALARAKARAAAPK